MGKLTKPNILVIWGDDIGISNLTLLQRRPDGLSHAQHRPHRQRGHAVHRLLRRAKLHRRPGGVHQRAERVPHRHEQSRRARCDIGWAPRIPTIAELLKPLGYATGQFGKNHFGDLNKYLPTVHGFDEFYGNLYHLNAEEEPEQFDYPHKDQFPSCTTALCRAACCKCKATDEVSTEPDDPNSVRSANRSSRTPARWTPSGWRPSTTTPPAPASTTSSASTRPARRSSCWMNTTHMHPVHPHQAGEPRPGRPVAVPLPRHDDRPRPQRRPATGLPRRTRHRRGHHRGLQHRQRAALATVGPTPAPRRSAARRTPTGRARSGCPRWCAGPERSRPASVSNEIIQHHDWLPTFLAAAGEPDIIEKLKKGHKAGGNEVQGPHRRLQPAALSDRRGETSPRRGFFYFSDDGDLRRACVSTTGRSCSWSSAARAPCGLGRALHDAAAAEAVQPAHRSLRARRHHVEHLLRLVPVEELHGRGRRRHRRAVPKDVRGIPAAAESGDVHHRQGAGQDEGDAGQRRPLSAMPPRRRRRRGTERRQEEDRWNRCFTSAPPM